jgi:ABC-2 type transport system ATP-binding protein
MIKIENFHKSFGTKKVINGLDFEVKKGQIFAFLGANGSGKTTTIRSLLGIYSPTEGRLTIDGNEYSHKMSHMIGYLPEERGLYLESKVLDIMKYFGQIKGLSSTQAEKFSKEYLEEVGLSDKAEEKIKKLSSGQQQKIQLGITLIHEPEVLILDEPTKGLDPVNRDLLMKKLFDLNKKGSTIMFSTHQMEEAEKVAQEILILKDGVAAVSGGLMDVKRSYGNNSIEIEFTGKLPENKELYEITRNENNARLMMKENTDPQEILTFLVSKNINITKFEVELPTLHEIFVEVYSSRQT